MLVNDRQRIRQYLPATVDVPLLFELAQVEPELIDQALAQVAAAHARRIHLPDHFKRFMQIAKREVSLEYRSSRSNSRFYHHWLRDWRCWLRHRLNRGDRFRLRRR